MHIQKVATRDARYELEAGAGTDAVHSAPIYSFAVSQLTSDSGLQGTGLVLTLGQGNELVCSAIEMLAEQLVGRELEELMANFGEAFRVLADHPKLRWLGPHKGVVHLALASITNACFDLWAKSRKQPLWNALLSLNAAEIANLLDLSYLEDVIDRRQVVAILEEKLAGREMQSSILKTGYPGYDTSVGWYGYDDRRLSENLRRSVDQGFTAFKLKVGGALDVDVRRAHVLREVAGPGATIMLDANQQWSLPKAITACRELASVRPYWIEEPTHPDDIVAHTKLAAEIEPLSIAIGEHVPNRVVFKNYLEAGAVKFLQPDCTRLGGVSEFLTVSLLGCKYNVPVVPHVGDMGQIHQHLALFNHIALGLPEVFLEHIPHLRSHFVTPASVSGGRYRTPQEPGSSSDLL